MSCSKDIFSLQGNRGQHKHKARVDRHGVVTSSAQNRRLNHHFKHRKSSCIEIDFSNDVARDAVPHSNDPRSRSDSGGDYSRALDEKPLGMSAVQLINKRSLLNVRKKLITPKKTNTKFKPLLGSSCS